MNSNHKDCIDCIDKKPTKSVKKLVTDPCSDTPEFVDKDEKVKVNPRDPSAGYLDEKLIVGECLTKSITSDFKLKIDLDFDCLCQRMANCSNKPCTPVATVPNIVTTATSICGLNQAVLTANNFNGTISWYRNGVKLPNTNTPTYTVMGEGGIYWVRNATQCGYTESAPVNISFVPTCACTPAPTVPFLNAGTISLQPFESTTLLAGNCNGVLSIVNASSQLVIGSTQAIVEAGTYYARCFNDCGAVTSSAITISTVSNPIYKAYRTNEFTRNNCGNNSCGFPGTGSTMTYSKTYESTVSQAAADALATADTNFSTEGQAYANSNGVCNFPPIPALTYNYSTVAPTCTGEVENANGVLSLFNLQNVTKIGYSSSGYSAITFANAVNVTTGLTVSNLSSEVYYVKVFLSELCYDQFTFTLDAPNCLQPQFTLAQPECNVDGSYTDAIVSIINATGYVGAEFSSTNTFTCTPLDGVVSGGNLTLNLPAPITTPTLTYKVRLYTDNSCVTYIEKTYVVARPTCFNYNLNYTKDCSTSKFVLAVTNAPVGATVKICPNTTFTCPNTCTPGDGTVNNSGISLISNLSMPNIGQSQVYTVRVYKSAACNFFVEKNITIINDCCNLTIEDSEIAC